MSVKRISLHRNMQCGRSSRMQIHPHLLLDLALGPPAQAYAVSIQHRHHTLCCSTDFFFLPLEDDAAAAAFWALVFVGWTGLHKRTTASAYMLDVV